MPVPTPPNDIPLPKKLFLASEAGLGTITRNGRPYEQWRDRWTPKREIDIHYGGGPNTAGRLLKTVEDDTVIRRLLRPVDQQVSIEMAQLQSWEEYHVFSQGWRGIAYNFAIGQSGRIYVLRGWNNNGAHYSNDDVDYDGIPSNVEGVAIVMIMGGHQKPSRRMKRAFRRLRRYLEQSMGHGLPLYGHFEVAESGGHGTKCPGRPWTRILRRKRFSFLGSDLPPPSMVIDSG